MKNFIIWLAIAFFMFGCTGGTVETPSEPSEEVVLAPPNETVEECTPAYSFSEPIAGVFSETTVLTGTATCAIGKELEITVDGETVATTTVQGAAISIDVPAIKDGTLELAVMSEGEILFSTDWNVDALGNSDVSGVDYDPISFKEWRAVAFDIENEIEVGRVDIYMKRLEGNTQPGTNLLVEIREDDEGEPGALVDSVQIPVTEATLNYKWVHFDFDPKVTLSEETYWVVAKIEQTKNIKVVSDVVMMHYNALDTDTEGNDYTREMRLDVDDETGFGIETEWQPVAYDKTYNVLLKSD
ncbi:hypothetical protein KKB44_05225 [Candidatus Micrarchaeota archaeon]|nr:hypothetical protein [Candidatus Micrarchaeota archaeon]